MKRFAARDDEDFYAKATENNVSFDKANMLIDAVDWIAFNCFPEDIFDDKELSTWAEANGYTKEDK